MGSIWNLIRTDTYFLQYIQKKTIEELEMLVVGLTVNTDNRLLKNKVILIQGIFNML